MNPNQNFTYQFSPQYQPQPQLIQYQQPLQQQAYPIVQSTYINQPIINNPMFSNIAKQNPIKKVLNYQYDIRFMLGNGSFSKVYLGKDEFSQQEVAVKIMNRYNLQKQQAERLAYDEINIMKQIIHPNVVQLYDMQQTNDEIYLILEYCNQGSLRQKIQKHKKIPEKEAIKILNEIIQGYNKMLEFKIMHRDMKPENILISEGRHKIADFGFAKILKDKNEVIKNQNMGTPLYSSLQILLNQDYTVKSDCWSIGIIFYEMLFGKTPWESQSVQELVQKIQKFPYVQIPENVISYESEDFLQRTLQVEEKNRLDFDSMFRHVLFTDKNEDWKKEEEAVINMYKPVKQQEIEQLQKISNSNSNSSQKHQYQQQQQQIPYQMEYTRPQELQYNQQQQQQQQQQKQNLMANGIEYKQMTFNKNQNNYYQQKNQQNFEQNQKQQGFNINQNNLIILDDENDNQARQQQFQEQEQSIFNINGLMKNQKYFEKQISPITIKKAQEIKEAVGGELESYIEIVEAFQDTPIKELIDMVLQDNKISKIFYQ